MVRFVSLLTAFPALFSLLIPGVAVAAEEGGAAVPQFDPTTYVPQLFWLVISFAILYVLMAKIALPRVGFVVEQRAQKIAQDLEQARTARDEAMRMQNGYEVGLSMTRNSAREQTADAVAKAQAAQSAALTAQNQALVARVQEAEKKIAIAKQTALNGIAPAADALAADMVKKLAGI